MAKNKVEEILKILKEKIKKGYSWSINDPKGELRVEIYSDIPDGVDLSGIDYLVFTRASKVGKGVKLPKRIFIRSFDATTEYNPPRGVDMSKDEWGRVTMTNPSRFTIFPSGDLATSGVKEILIDGSHVYFPAGVKMPKDVQLKFVRESLTYDKKQWSLEFDGHGYKVDNNSRPICGHIPDGLDLSNYKDITITQLGSLGKGIKFPKKVCLLMRHIPTGIDFSGIEILSVSHIHIPMGTDLSKITKLDISGELHLDKGVKLPKNINFEKNSNGGISGYIPQGTDLSAVKNRVVLYSPVIFGDGVKLPKDLHGYIDLNERDPRRSVKLTIVGGYIPDGTDLSNVNLDPESLKKITYLGKDVKFDSSFSKKYAQEIKRLRLKGAKDRVTDSVIKLKKDVKANVKKAKQSIRKIFRGDRGNEM